MREIKFRGRASNGEWIYGSLVRIGGELVGIKPDTTPFIGDNVRVAPDTVGQYTGLCDAFCREIYEGDMLTARTADKEYSFRVCWDVAAMRWGALRQDGYMCPLDSFSYCTDQWDHAGNVFDNSEMTFAK